MKQSLTLLVAVLAMTAGCSTTTDLSGRMADWQGQDVAQALENWGAPETREAFGDQTVLIWRDRDWALLPEDAQTRVDSPAVICERMLAVTDSGEITGWRWRGDACSALHADGARSPALLSSNAY